MDEEIDLTLECLFARKTEPRLMLDVHYEKWKEKENNHIDFKTSNFFELREVVSDIMIIDPDSDKNFEILDMIKKVSIKESNDYLRDLDPYVYMYENCDNCGDELTPINTIKNYLICKNCNRELEEGLTESII